VAACVTSSLSLTLTTDARTYTLGQQPVFTGSIENNGTVPCTFTESPQKEIWTITSGPAQVWSTKDCKSSTLAKAVKIKPGKSKSVSITWDGKRNDQTCTPGDAATAGTYILTATLDGVPATGTKVFSLTS
jgi:hypothetical protein